MDATNITSTTTNKTLQTVLLHQQPQAKTINSKPELITINVHNDSEITSLTVNPETLTLGQLKSLYAKKTGDKTKDMRFMYCTRELQENETPLSKEYILGDDVHFFVSIKPDSYTPLDLETFPQETTTELTKSNENNTPSMTRKIVLGMSLMLGPLLVMGGIPCLLAAFAPIPAISALGPIAAIGIGTTALLLGTLLVIYAALELSKPKFWTNMTHNTANITSSALAELGHRDENALSTINLNTSNQNAKFNSLLTPSSGKPTQPSSTHYEQYLDKVIFNASFQPTS